jgi:hypothetical protein
VALDLGGNIGPLEASIGSRTGSTDSMVAADGAVHELL